MALRGAASELSRCVQAPWGPSGSVTAQPSCGKIRMAGPQVSDAELVETFIGQSDRVVLGEAPRCLWAKGGSLAHL